MPLVTFEWQLLGVSTRRRLLSTSSKWYQGKDVAQQNWTSK
jgi:hypothetical protein